MAAAAAVAAAAHRGSGGGQSRTTTLLSLPEEVLGLVLAKAGRKEGRAVPMVCRRLHAAFYSTPRLWQEVTIAPTEAVAGLRALELTQWFDMQRRLLQRVGAMVQRLSLAPRWPAPDPAAGAVGAALKAAVSRQMVELLTCLLGSAAPRHIDCRGEALRLTPAATAALGRLSSLEQLELGLPYQERGDAGERCRILGDPAAMLSGLGRLTALTLRVHSLWGRSSPVEAICSLTRLAKLQISSTEPLPAALGPRLTALCQLEELQLSETCIHNEWLALAMPAPHDLPRLRAFSMTAEHLQLPDGGRLTGCIMPPGAEEDAPCRISSFRCQCPSCDKVNIRVVNVCFEHSSGMGSVLSARVPGSLERLVFSACHLAWAGPPEDLPPEQAEALAGVQGLLIEDCSVEPGEEALGGLLRQLPALEELSFDNCTLDAESLGELLDEHCHALTRLELTGCAMSGLPPGDYLSGLEDLTLSLYGSQLERLPPELASATRLTGLRLGGNRSLAVTPQEADTLLALPGLQQLELWGTATPHQVLLGMVQHVLSSPGLSGLLLLVGQPPSSDGVEGVVRAEEEEEEEGDEDWGSDDDAEEETSA